MIRQEDIIDLMKGTRPFTKKTLSRLSNLIEKYPYFQTAHLLHTLNLLYLKDTYFLFDLRKTAVYAPDRKQLFFRIESDFFDPELIETLEKETLPSDSSSELIDTFLSESDKKPVEAVKEPIAENVKKPEVKSDKKPEPKIVRPESLPVSTDYITYFLSDDSEKEEVPPLQHQETIDKFLEKDAVSPLRIKLDKTNEPEKEFPEEKELPESISEPADGGGFFSETLAKIYIKQKKYDKALEILRKLNLIYPEKSRYFADQIQFLEKLIIYTNKNI
ncbi:MAG: tetratricopeptide repeat protein [Candidatus Azobacteroides sp.]|nr:tetratricopeptide repeat protein [Candidatus Azobacteroides sp.]